jgi:hypothetical protein
MFESHASVLLRPRQTAGKAGGESASVSLVSSGHRCGLNTQPRSQSAYSSPPSFRERHLWWCGEVSHGAGSRGLVPEDHDGSGLA